MGAETTGLADEAVGGAGSAAIVMVEVTALVSASEGAEPFGRHDTTTSASATATSHAPLLARACGARRRRHEKRRAGAPIFLSKGARNKVVPYRVGRVAADMNP